MLSNYFMGQCYTSKLMTTALSMLLPDVPGGLLTIFIGLSFILGQKYKLLKHDQELTLLL